MRFGGHETFPIREGWLTKGLQLIDTDPALLDRHREAADALGVGHNMAKAIRHWLLVTGLAERPRRQAPLQRSAFGDVVFEHDRYLIEPTTWWAIHANLVLRDEAAVTWSWFFNHFEHERFDRMTCVDQLARYATARYSRTPSRNTLTRDVQCLLATYARPLPPPATEDPEEGRDSPLRELGLVTHYTESDTYRIHRGNRTVPAAALAYAFARRFGAMDEAGAQASFPAVLAAAGGLGRIFALSGEGLAAAIDAAEYELDGGLTTAMLGGERVIHIAARAPEAWLAESLTALGAAA